MVKARVTRKVNLAKVKFTTKVSGSGNAHVWKKKGEVLTGIYQSFSKHTFRGKETFLHKFVDAKGKEFAVWQSTVLACLSDVKKGTPVQIKYLGDVGKGRKRYRNFEVMTP